MQILVWKLLYQNFSLSIHHIPPFWALFWQLFQIKSVAEQSPYFLKVTEQADSVWTDLLLKPWKAQSAFMGGSPSPVAPDLLSWAQVRENASRQSEEPAVCVLAGPSCSWSSCVGALTLHKCELLLYPLGMSPSLVFVEMTCFCLWRFLFYLFF